MVGWLHVYISSLFPVLYWLPMAFLRYNVQPRAKYWVQHRGFIIYCFQQKGNGILKGGQNYLNWISNYTNSKKKFPFDGQTTLVKSLSQLVNLPGAHSLMKPLTLWLNLLCPLLGIGLLPFILPLTKWTPTLRGEGEG